MTTKYQRGDPIDGWNDCPPMNSRGSSSVSLPLEGGDDTLSTDEIKQHIDDLFSRPTNLPTREHEHYYSKMVGSLDHLSNTDRVFVAQILDRVRELYETRDSLVKKLIVSELLDYMIVNHGVSKWCTPLRKAIEKVQL